MPEYCEKCPSKLTSYTIIAQPAVQNSKMTTSRQYKAGKKYEILTLETLEGFDLKFWCFNLI